MYKMERRVALHFVLAGLSEGIILFVSFETCRGAVSRSLLAPFALISAHISLIQPAFICISNSKSIAHTSHLFTHPSMMLFTSVVSVAVLVAGLNAAPVKPQKRQAPAGVPEFVIKYGKQLLFSSTIHLQTTTPRHIGIHGLH